MPISTALMLRLSRGQREIERGGERERNREREREGGKRERKRERERGGVGEAGVGEVKAPHCGGGSNRR